MCWKEAIFPTPIWAKCELNHPFDTVRPEKSANLCSEFAPALPGEPLKWASVRSGFSQLIEHNSGNLFEINLSIINWCWLECLFICYTLPLSGAPFVPFLFLLCYHVFSLCEEYVLHGQQYATRWKTSLWARIWNYTFSVCMFRAL